ncbi:MAG: ABC-ATPase domain-containing protein [Candidatus Dormibacteraeota bacterium]|nr:ABC-ATPase domain-containing protein [Candidatus Dormibacteraeota bacterium]MBO0760932.1 ABC-ATPase domain-containing protein [Candidatus Dormibacteraeota bacterium]
MTATSGLGRADLARVLRSLDGSGYGGYKRLRGGWDFEGWRLGVDLVQADPYAPPSRLSVRRPTGAGFPDDLLRTPVRRRALADWLLRRAARELRDRSFRVDAGGQEVLDRSACRVGADGSVVLRLAIELPGMGRRIAGRQAARLLCEDLPAAVERVLRWPALPEAEIREFVAAVEDSEALREQLADRGLLSFVADGSILPRRSGVDPRPLPQGAVPFASPPSMRVELEVPNRGRIAGMGIREGVTLIVGGGFHGKSTLLRALELGIFDHVPGDGRELAVTREDAVRVRAEDGRRVARVDIGTFLSNLPVGGDTRDFSTDNASGSTSQAASIAEAVEAGARALFVDEDTAATNLMIRDARMQALVHKGQEPLTPLVDLVRPLHRELGVSTVLVMGGSGDYFDVADTVLMLDAFRATDVTDQARDVATRFQRRVAEAEGFAPLRHRVVDPESLDGWRKGRLRVRPRGVEALTFGDETIDLSAVEQLVDPSQVVGVGLALAHLASASPEQATLTETLDILDGVLTAQGLEALGEDYAGDYARPRRFEVAAALNRLRTLRVAQQQSGG